MKMYRVVIADDNNLIREALKRTIPWSRLDCEVVAEAEDGIEEKQAILKYRPDIILTDIKMPGMDGLEVAEYLKEHKIETKVILITGYNDFQYAQKAVKLGVFDLVLKPIQDGELIKILERAVGEIKKERKDRSFQEQLVEENIHYKERIRDADRIMQVQALRDLAHGHQTEGYRTEGHRTEGYLTEVHRTEGDRTEGHRKDGPGELDAAWADKRCIYVIGRLRTLDEERGKRALARIGEVITRKSWECICLERRSGREIELLFLPGRQDSASMVDIRMKNRLRELAGITEKECGTSICFSVSGLSEGLGSLQEMREQALDILDKNFFSAREQILFYRHYNTAAAGEGDAAFKDIENFHKLMARGEGADIEKEVENLLGRLEQITCGNEFRIKCFLSEICITMYRKYYLGRLPGQERKKNINDILGEINRLGDMEQTRKYLLEMARRLYKTAREEKEYENPIAGEAVVYIREHFSDTELSLTSAAEVLNVNSSYLSRLLKKETGMNFIDILTSVRLDKAKQLLEDGSKATAVGSMVGYKDYSYFYQVFKRVEGVSPTEYKKKAR